MKVSVTIEVDINFDLSDGEGNHSDESVIDAVKVKAAIDSVIHDHLHDTMAYEMVDNVSDETGWCINSLTYKTI